MDYVVYQGHILDVVFDNKKIKENSVQVAVSSPPYWNGVRDYSIEPSIWPSIIFYGLENTECNHEWSEIVGYKTSGRNDAYNSFGCITDNKVKKKTARRCVKTKSSSGQFCKKCGSWKGVYGCEPTPELYVWHTILIFEAYRYVLHNTGTLWWNIGDNYFGTGCGKGTGNFRHNTSKERLKSITKQKISSKHFILKRKDLCNIPAKISEALKMPWIKCNHCKYKNHSYTFPQFMSGNVFVCPSCGEIIYEPEIYKKGWYLRSDVIWSKPNPTPGGGIKDRPTLSHEHLYQFTLSDMYYYDWYNGLEPSVVDPNKLRNRRTVWEIPTNSWKPNDGAKVHFAMFPEKLIKPCILTGSSDYGCCSKCYSPYKRLIEYGENVLNTVGWKPTCKCNSKVIPCTVFDGFSGSGTTGVVACNYKRKYVGVDLNVQYIKFSNKRIQNNVSTLIDFI